MSGEMAEAVQNMLEHRARMTRTDRTGWTRQQWVDDARALMDGIDGSVQSLVNGHVLALLDHIAGEEARVDAAKAEVVRAVEAELDDADQIIDTLERPNQIAVWGVRRVLMRFGGKPHRWPVPAEKCGECGHLSWNHAGPMQDHDGCGDCDCLLSRHESEWGRDEELDDTIQQAVWEDAVADGEEWAMGDRAALRDATHTDAPEVTAESAEGERLGPCWRGECRESCYYPDACSEVTP